MKTKQTKTLKVYTCLLTSQQIRNCIGYTLCKAQSLLSFWNNSYLVHSPGISDIIKSVF